MNFLVKHWRFLVRCAACAAALALTCSLTGLAVENEGEAADMGGVTTGTVTDYGDESLLLPDGTESSLKKVGEKGTLSLYADLLTGEFAVRDSASGGVWFSNPYDRWDDPFSGGDRPATFSLMLAHYVDTATNVDEYPTSFAACEIEDGITVERIENGIFVSFHFVEANITIPLTVVLTEHGVKASVDVTKIREEGKKTLMDFSLLPYFGAGSTQDTGYIVVPDGSGALIEFNNGKQNFNRYQEPIYGQDVILTGETRTKLCELNSLPLFGIKKGDTGFAAIVTEGDAVAKITAGVSKKGSGYNNAYAGFTLRSESVVTLAGKGIRMIEKGKPHVESCAVEYRLLTGEQANYTGIAKCYGAYLQEQGVSPKPVQKTALFAELYGGMRLDRSVLGVPTKVTEPLTTFEQAQKIAAALKKAGVENLIVDYQDHDANALEGKLANRFSPEGKLGGNGGYEKLYAALSAEGTPLVSNVNLTSFAYGGNGISTNSHSAKAFAGLPGQQYTFNLATGQANPAFAPLYYLAPGKLTDVVKQHLESFDAKRYGAIGLDTLTTALYSDFSADGYRRQLARNAFAGAATRLSEQADLYVRGGAAYMLPAADYIFDLPDDDSQYDIVDRAIPLYQLAVSGRIPYSLTAVNAKSDPDLQVLKAAEYGGDLKFNFTYSDPGITGDPSLGHLNGVWYEQWLDYAAESYRRIAELREQTGHVLIGHETVSEGVYVTTYENGARVAVNYTDAAVTVDGESVPATDFVLLNGGGN